MPWRGPEYPGEFPSLGWLVADWIQAHCAIPDRHQAGEAFVLTDEQLEFLVWHYRLKPDAVVDPDKPSAPFAYDGSVLVRGQKWGKGPLAAADTCAQAEGPVLFGGWDANGEPVGMPWATPHIQITAVSEDQTDNIWRLLIPMIELGALSADIDDTGLSRVNLRSGGLIEPVTASAVSRLGQRITRSVQDQTESWLKANKGTLLADNQRRGLAGTGGRWLATPNAYDRTQKSVAQMDCEHPTSRMHIDFPESLPGSWKNMRDRRRIIKHHYRDCPWVDVDRIMGEAERLDKKGDPAQGERWFGNRVVSGADDAFDLEVWRSLALPGEGIAAGRVVTLGFDGARRRDTTGLVATDVETGHQMVVGVWERPEWADEDWEIDADEVSETVAEAFRLWDVWRMYADPPWWETHVDLWASQHTDRKGQPKVVAWWTNRRRAMALSLQAYHSAQQSRLLTHDGHQVMEAHIGHAKKILQPGMLDEEGHQLWLISKDAPDSPRKIDLAMAGCLSWEARGDAVAAGALKRKSGVAMAW